MPVLDYLNDEDKVSEKDRRSIGGLFKLMATDGIGAFNIRTIKSFKGEDAADGMMEFRRKAHRGHRILAFQCRGTDKKPTVVLAHAFEKPNQRETPKEDKQRAREVFAAHRARERRQEGRK